MQLGDRTISLPQGKVMDVRIKAKRLLFSVDCIVLDIENWNILVILGRSFLAMRRILIDMEKG